MPDHAPQGGVVHFPNLVSAGMVHDEGTLSCSGSGWSCRQTQEHLLVSNWWLLLQRPYCQAGSAQPLLTRSESNSCLEGFLEGSWAGQKSGCVKIATSYSAGLL